MDYSYLYSFKKNIILFLFLVLNNYFLKILIMSERIKINY
jgi:hypothetical protein